LFVAEQTRLLVRLAADTGARRGEMAVLRLADLDRPCADDRAWPVAGGARDDQDQPEAAVTLGATTTAMIVEHFESWRQRVGVGQVVGDSIFSADFRRLSSARADLLSHRFERLRLAAAFPMRVFTASAAASLPNWSARADPQSTGSARPSRPRHHPPALRPCHSLDDVDLADHIDDLLNAV